MPWTSVTIDIDADKVGSGNAEAAQVKAVYTYADSSTFVYTERVDQTTRAGLANRAHLALVSNTAKKTRQETLQGNLLTALQALDPT